MRKSTLFALIVLVWLPVIGRAQRVEVRQEVLPNGMKLLMVERHDSPTIAAGWVAHVGAVNERPGITGISHLFEHMMFKGTKTIGISDYAKDRQIMDQQDAVRARMEEEYSKLRKRLRRGEIKGNIYDPANMTPRLKELRAELQQLFAAEKKIIVKDEMDHIYTREGGSGLNAGTTEDLTAYFINIPANKLELWFWMESDRLLNPVFREFYSERDVVREERRRSVESTPTGKLNELFDAMFWESSPYSWPVVGWPSDVESINREEADRYFATYYAPNNITAVLVGDFDSSQALDLARRYFGRIPRGKTPPPEVITDEMPQLGEKTLRAEAETNTQVSIRYHAVPFMHRDMYAFTLLADVLNGRTGRLYKSLVEKDAVALGRPRAFYRDLKYAGYFQMSAQVKEGKSPEEVKSALLSELERLKKEPIGERELQKVKNQELANAFRRLHSNFFLLFQLLQYDAYGDWHYINEYPAKLQAVTASEIQQVARQYFSPENRNVAIYLRKQGSQPEMPELVGLPAQVQSMIKQRIARIESSTDAAQLQATLVQVQQVVGHAPEPMKPAFQLVIRKIQERLKVLSQEHEKQGAASPKPPEGGNQ